MAFRNIEIKAKLGSDENFEKCINLAENITGTPGTIIAQKDVFFNATQGRLKLRYLQDTPSQLIHYFRSDVEGPKMSTFNILDVDNPKLLETILTDSIGVKGKVVKTRTLFLYQGSTRIHLDKVDNLGNFLEFEIILKPSETAEDGNKIANELMKIFNIQDLIAGSYLDELIRN